MPCLRLLAVGREDRPVEQPADAARRPAMRTQGPSGDGTSLTATSSVGTASKAGVYSRSAPLERWARSAGRRPASRGAGASPELALLDPLARPGDEPVAHVADDRGVPAPSASSSWRNAPPLGELAQLERPGDPAAIGRGELVEQAGIVSLPRQQLAEQPQPALAVARDQGRAPLGEEQVG